MAEAVRSGLERLQQDGSIRNIRWSSTYRATVLVEKRVFDDAMPVMEEIRRIDGVRQASIVATTN
jgi:hypothetical protein